MDRSARIWIAGGGRFTGCALARRLRAAGFDRPAQLGTSSGAPDNG